MRRPAALRTAKALLALLLFCSVPIVYAEDSNVTALRDQLGQLKNLMQDFEARLNKLEQQRGGVAASGVQQSLPPAAEVSASRPAQPAAAAPPTQAEPTASAGPQAPRLSRREGWLQIKDGMTQTDINALVGPPHKTFSLNGKMVWYYLYPGIGAGSVFFNADGHSSSHQTPPLGWVMW